MNRSKTLRAMVLAVLVLTIAAATPENTVRTLQLPQRASNKAGMFVGEHVYSWQTWKWRKEAENGNLKEMYRVGSYMMNEHIFHTASIPFEPEKGKEFLVGAAEGGYAPAKLKLWRVEGESPEVLEELASDLLQGGVSGQPLQELAGWLHWYAKQECSAELAALSRSASEEIALEIQSNAGDNQDAFEAEFSQACSGAGKSNPSGPETADA